MSSHKVFSVYDSKMGCYARPFHTKTLGEAMRSWSDFVNERGTAANNHPEDFTLFELAEFDEDTGLFIPHNTPIARGKALELHKAYAGEQVHNP